MLIQRLSYAQEKTIRMLSNEYQDIPASGGPSEATLNVLLSMELAEPDLEGAREIGPLKAYRWRLTSEGDFHKLALGQRGSK